jgi:hypothetical protein
MTRDAIGSCGTRWPSAWATRPAAQQRTNAVSLPCLCPSFWIGCPGRFPPPSWIPACENAHRSSAMICWRPLKDLVSGTRYGITMQELRVSAVVRTWPTLNCANFSGLAKPHCGGRFRPPMRAAFGGCTEPRSHRPPRTVGCEPSRHGALVIEGLTEHGRRRGILLR